jgi:ribosome-associated translation inhibitor RaiA
MNISQLNGQIIQKGYVLLLDRIKKYIEQKLNKKIKLNSDINGVYIYLTNIEFDKLDNDTLKIFNLKKRDDNTYYIIISKSVDINSLGKLEHQINKLLYKEKKKNQSDSDSSN